MIDKLAFPEFYNFLTSISTLAYDDEKIFRLKDKQEDMLSLMKECNAKITHIKICRYKEIDKDYLKSHEVRPV